MLVDKNARHRNLPVVFQPENFFGQLQHIIVVEMGSSEELGLDEPETIILGAIRTCADAKTSASGHGIYYYSQEGCLEVIDIDCIQCGVGRIKYSSRWAIVDRSGEHARSVFVDNIDDE
jgi:hypothetical protein